MTNSSINGGVVLRIASNVPFADEGDIPVAADFDTGSGPMRYFFVADRVGSILGVLNDAGDWLERMRLGRSYD